MAIDALAVTVLDGSATNPPNRGISPDTLAITRISRERLAGHCPW
ncbi:hypothetical protein [Halocatena salina]|nr:hypothetical protein [Halocatena salina]